MNFKANLTDAYVKQMYQGATGTTSDGKVKNGKAYGHNRPEAKRPADEKEDKAAVYEKGAQSTEKAAIYQKPVKNEKQSELQAKLSETYEKLSDAAKQYLSELKEKYGNIEFFVADCKTDEEMNQYFKLGQKDYSCVISTETIEKMATDEATREKYESIIAGAGEKFEEIKTELKEELGEEAASQVESFGFTIDDNGVATYFAKLKESSDSYYAKQKEAIKAKRAEQKEEEKLANEKKALEKKNGPNASETAIGVAAPQSAVAKLKEQLLGESMEFSEQKESSLWIHADSKEGLLEAIKAALLGTEE